MSGDDIRAEVDAAARKVMDVLQAAGKPATAWELKMALNMPHTRLHLALGALLERRSIRMRPDSLTYIVEPVTADDSDAPAEPRVCAEKIG
ncbi:MAG: hypothetical protein ABIJ96_07270 [Elusimicrobiota bacterium]